MLLKEHHPLSTDGATSKLLDSVERRIGEMLLLQVGAGREASAKTAPVVPEQTKRFFEALLEKPPAKPLRSANPPAAGTQSPVAAVSKHSLSLLDVRPPPPQLNQTNARHQRRDIEFRIAEIERKLRVLDAAVESLCQSRDTPIVTPTTSVASTAEESGGVRSGLDLGARAFLFA